MSITINGRIYAATEMEVGPNTRAVIGAARTFGLIGKRGASALFTVFENGVGRFLPMGNATPRARDYLPHEFSIA